MAQELTAGTGLIARYGLTEGSRHGRRQLGRRWRQRHGRLRPAVGRRLPGARHHPAARPERPRRGPGQQPRRPRMDRRERRRPGRLPRLPRHQPACRHDRQRPLRRAPHRHRLHRPDCRQRHRIPVRGRRCRHHGNRSAASTPRPSRRPRPPARPSSLDGTNDYVTFGAAPALGATNFTLETWFRRDGAGIGVTTGTGGITVPSRSSPRAVPRARPGQPEHELLPRHRRHQRQARGRLRGHDRGGNHPVAGTAVVTSNVWHHAAATYDAVSGTWKLYLDGVLDRTLVLASAFQPQSTSIQHAALGSSLTLDRRPPARLLQRRPRRGPHLERGPQGRPDRLHLRQDPHLRRGPDCPIRPQRGHRHHDRLERRGSAGRHAHQRTHLDRRSGALVGQQHGTGLHQPQLAHHGPTLTATVTATMPTRRAARHVPTRTGAQRRRHQWRHGHHAQPGHGRQRRPGDPSA